MTSSAVVIRKAEASETEHLVELAMAAWDKDLRPFLSGTAASATGERRRLQLAVHDLLQRIIVADVDGEAAGWCARARTRAYVPYLFVDPRWQGQGLGTLLLSRTETLLSAWIFTRTKSAWPARASSMPLSTTS